jgi:hypothetical protein
LKIFLKELETFRDVDHIKEILKNKFPINRSHSLFLNQDYAENCSLLKIEWCFEKSHLPKKQTEIKPMTDCNGKP